MAACGFRGGPAGGLAHGLRAHDHALAVDLDHQLHLSAAGEGDPGAVEVVGVDRGRDHQFFESAFAHTCPKRRSTAWLGWVEQPAHSVTVTRRRPIECRPAAAAPRRWGGCCRLRGRDEDDDYLDDYRKAFSDIGDDAWYPERGRGTIPISDNGCGMTGWLILVGPHRGELRDRDCAVNPSFEPYVDANGSRHTFRSWYLEWLEQRERAAR